MKKPRHKWPFGYVSVAILLLAMALIQIAVLKTLPNATSLITTVSIAKVHEEPPPTSAFSLGGVDWDIDAAMQTSKLKPIRDHYAKICSRHSGLMAAQKVSDELARAIPFGNPTDEFFSSGFDPTAQFNAHVEKSEPGHCVTLSGLLATALLSNGIPARVVQLVPTSGTVSGHTVVEVWEESFGWVVYDPTFGGTLMHQGKTCSAVEALQHADQIRFQPTGKPSSAIDSSHFYDSESFPLLKKHHGFLMYPEPWLYLRTGTRDSFWPFRGRFVRVGEPSWKYGPAQMILRFGTLSALVASSVCFIVGLWRRRVMTWRSAAE